MELQEGWKAVVLSQKLGTTTSQFHTHQNHLAPSIHENNVGPPLNNDLPSFLRLEGRTAS